MKNKLNLEFDEGDNKSTSREHDAQRQIKDLGKFTYKYLGNIID
jgi:hypothetical protein